MTRIFVAILILFFSASVFAQNQGFNYQAVAREGQGAVQANTSLDVRFTIFQNNLPPAGLIVYQETHSVTTSDLGLFTVVVSDGVVDAGDFSTITWNGNTHFLRVELDDNGSWVEMGTSELEAVPYAKHALSAETADNANTADALTNPIWQKPGSIVSLADAGSVVMNDVRVNPEGSSVAMRLDTALQFQNGTQATYIYANGDGQMVFSMNSVGSSAPELIIDDDNGGVIVKDKLKIDAAPTLDPEPGTLHSNSLPIAYGYISGIAVQVDYGVASVSSPNTGEYEVTLSNGFSGTPVIIASPYNPTGSDEIVSVGQWSASQNRFTIYVSDETGSPVVSNFFFVVYGTPD